tara:strand:+ start:513 stop:914 length:402 start_codon:yes stop_codon:yes gene_type:complete
MVTKIKVYYEDTDASSRVYYANYLKYLERGRSDFLYKLGFDHKNLLNKYNFYFVVKSCNIEYLKPAHFEDILEVKTKIINITKAKIEFNQLIFREKTLLIDSKIIIVSVNRNSKISKIPNEMLEILNQQLTNN